MTATADSHRELYARLITSGVDERWRKALEQAFRRVRREDFLGPGPWSLVAAGGYVQTPSADPALLYQDVLVALKKERRLNNGQPSLHARCIAALQIEPACSIAHIGAGSGYYTAVLAELAGDGGRVSAYEIDPELADTAARNLAPWPTVSVFGDAVHSELATTDVIYVNAGVAGPPAHWLAAVATGGRLLLPLTDQRGQGGMLLLRRVLADRFDARFLSPVSFIACVGARDESSSRQLAAAFGAGLARNTRSLVLGQQADESSLLQGDGWWLSSRSAS